MAHTYAIGRSGTGKSTWLAARMADDLFYSANFALLDPHGDLANQIADAADPNRTIYFHHSCPLGFNPFDKHTAEDILSSFKHVWAESWGPRMEYILRMALMLLKETPRPTLLHISRILTDTSYRRECLRYAANPVVRYFWEQEFEAWSERYRAEAIGPIQNKAGEFAVDPTLQRVLAGKTTLDFDDILNGKVFIANLSGIGREPSHLLGALFVTAIHQAAARRVTIPESERSPFTLYADEFQHFATDSFGVILAESRKWGLSLTLANQFLGQLPDTLRQAVLGNISTLYVFRVGGQDAPILARELGIEEKNAGTLTDTPNFEARMRATRDGTPGSPTLVQLAKPNWPRTGMLRSVFERMRARYAQPPDKVEQRIATIFSGRNDSTTRG